jgi:phosphoglucan, water dikinase
LSGYEEEECLAVERELEAWSKDFRDEIPEDLLRLKSTIDRILRLAAEYSDRILAIFSEKVEALGRALGVPDHAVRVYGEAEIRRNPVFQVSKIASLYLKEIRERCGLPPWDRIVPGKASGLLVHSPDLFSLGEGGGGPIVASIERVEGDEEIPEGVVGLIVPHEVPHLSHLAVRARQRSTVFVVCEEPERFRSLRELAGKWLLLDAETEDFRVREIPPIEKKANPPRAKNPLRPAWGFFLPLFPGGKSFRSPKSPPKPGEARPLVQGGSKRCPR